MKIGIIGTRGIPNHYGGFEQFAQQLSVGLVKKKHEVVVYNSHLHPYKEKEWRGVTIVHCSDWEDKIGTAGQFIYDLNCIHDARKRNFDILLHLGYTSDAVWYWHWPKKTIHIVNMDGLEWKRSKYNRITQRFLKWSESLAAKNADVLIADSPGIQEHLLATFQKQSVYIPYGTKVFTENDPAVLEKYKLIPQQYFLLVARMEPENNIEMVIKGWLGSNQKISLVIIGNINNRFGSHITAKYSHPGIQFIPSIYDEKDLNNLRYYSALYFHGHSVGGTNPSLLEAMACGCTIAAHDNIFNGAVLQNEADYFSSSGDVALIMNNPGDFFINEKKKKLNVEKINIVYNTQKIVDDYETIMHNACFGNADHC